MITSFTHLTKLSMSQGGENFYTMQESCSTNRQVLKSSSHIPASLVGHARLHHHPEVSTHPRVLSNGSTDADAAAATTDRHTHSQDDHQEQETFHCQVNLSRRPLNRILTSNVSLGLCSNSFNYYSSTNFELNLPQCHYGHHVYLCHSDMPDVVTSTFCNCSDDIEERRRLHLRSIGQSLRSISREFSRLSKAEDTSVLAIGNDWS